MALEWYPRFLPNKVCSGFVQIAVHSVYCSGASLTHTSCVLHLRCHDESHEGATFSTLWRFSSLLVLAAMCEDRDGCAVKTKAVTNQQRCRTGARLVKFTSCLGAWGSFYRYLNVLLKKHMAQG